MTFTITIPTWFFWATFIYGGLIWLPTYLWIVFVAWATGNDMRPFGSWMSAAGFAVIYPFMSASE